MRRFGSFCLGVMLACHSNPSSGQDVVELSICYAPEASETTGWQRSSLAQIAQVLRTEGTALELRVRRASCNDSMPDSTCAGLPGHMFCRQPSFERIQIAAAWFVAMRARSGALGYEAFRRAHPRAVVEAFRFADGANTDPEIKSIVEQIRDHAEQTAVGPADPGSSLGIAASTEVQSRIVAFNVAALVGHEAHHMNEEVCPVSEISWGEENGIFDHIVELQVSDRLFCSSSPDPNEMRADRCAIRQIRRLQAAAIDSSDDPVPNESFARRVAADMVAFQALSGFRRFDQLPDGIYVIPGLDQYFQPALRLMLLAGEIPDPRSGPSVCGEAAGLFVHAVQVGFQECAGEGEVSDELLALLPPGVEESWNGAPWTPDSFNCDLE